MKEVPRVAYFPDSFREVNGVAMTSKKLIAYVSERDYPFLCVHADKTTSLQREGSVTYLALKRPPAAFAMDEDLAYDPLFQRHVNRVLRELLDFAPDVIHITGLSDVSIIGAYLAWKLQLPLVGSWHTNIHEFAASRLSRMLRFLPKGSLEKITAFAERKIRSGAVLYYKMPKVVLSPNQELVDLLGRGTGRVSRLMTRGVDTDYFTPAKRTVSDGVFRLGFVGRLRAEKNVRLLVDLEKGLRSAGKTNYEFLIVGEGNEREYLESNLQQAKFTGFLNGELLAEAYANMDLFVFPSETDAFGNVAQEANASGVPAIVTNLGGPKFIIKHNETGFIAEDLEEFTKFTIRLMDNADLADKMRSAAREHAMERSWDSVFDSVYRAYYECIELEKAAKASKTRAAAAK